MNLNIDIEAIVSEAIEKSLGKDRLTKLIQEHVAKVADSAIASVFSDGGDFVRAVKKSISELVPHELKLDKQADWNHYISTSINQRVTEINDQRMKDIIAPMLEKILETPPESVKLSQILQDAAQYWNEFNSDEFNGIPHLEIECSRGITAGYTDIYISKKAPSSKYISDIIIKVDRTGNVWGVKFNESDIEKQKFAGPFFDIEQKLFQLYACKTKIEIDVQYAEDVEYIIDHDDEGDD